MGGEIGKLGSIFTIGNRVAWVYILFVFRSLVGLTLGSVNVQKVLQETVLVDRLLRQRNDDLGRVSIK